MINDVPSMTLLMKVRLSPECMSCMWYKGRLIAFCSIFVLMELQSI